MLADLTDEVARRQGELIGLRREIHRNPELAFQEERTAALVADRLRRLGLEVQTGVAGTGVVGLLRGMGPGRTLLLRADMDALPIQELGDSDYRSRADGVMHACGHDGHVAMALTAAEVLATYRDRLAGCVKFLFQPAEETASGALPMLRAGVLRDPPVDGVLALHLWASLETGVVGVGPGPLFASADTIDIDVRGQGGHGALPHQTKDAILAAAQAIVALQSVVSRRVPPARTAVLTIGMIQGGTARNVVADVVRLRGTLRALDPETRALALEAAEDVVRGTCLALGTDYTFQATPLCPPCVNDEGMAALVRGTAERLFGEERVIAPEASTVGDDMAYFLEEVPGCYALLGCGGADPSQAAGHHNGHFDIDEAALGPGVQLLVQATLDYLGEGV